MSKQISQGFRACLKVKKIKKQILEIRPGSRRQLAKTLYKVKPFASTAVTRELVIGCANKLAEVLEHVLGMRKY